MSQEELMDEGKYANEESQEAAEAEVPEIDFERAALLLGIMKDVTTVGPMNSYIFGEAAEELKYINEDCRRRALARADVIHRQEAEAAQARAQELKTANEETVRKEKEREERERIAREAPQVVEDDDHSPNGVTLVDRRGA